MQDCQDHVPLLVGALYPQPFGHRPHASIRSESYVTIVSDERRLSKPFVLFRIVKFCLKMFWLAILLTNNFAKCGLELQADKWYSRTSQSASHVSQRVRLPQERVEKYDIWGHHTCASVAWRWDDTGPHVFLILCTPGWDFIFSSWQRLFFMKDFGWNSVIYDM